MPRPARAPKAIPSNSLVAAGMNMRSAAPLRPTYQHGQPWQRDAWHFFNTVGELRYAATYFSKVLSRARLYAATRDGKDFKEQTSGSVFEIVSGFFGGVEGQSQALASIGVHLFVVGECYVVGRAPQQGRDKGTERIWEVVGIEEMRHTGDDWSIDYGDGLPLKLDGSPNGDDVIRIWYPHPQKRINADSPVRAILPTLGEIERLSQHIQAQIVSRLTGAGLLLLPQGITFPSPPGTTMPEDATEADKVMASIYEAMMAAVQNPGDASAVAPIVMLVPDEFVDKANLVKFWSDLDQHSIAMRGDAIKRAAIGLDLPVEVLTGTADVNHWGSWQIEESSIKAHFEPALELIVHALSVGYVTEASEDPNGVIRWDTSSMRLRPNRSKEAIELYDRGELKAEALRRETGFSKDDAPEKDEQKTWWLSKVAANSSATPEMMAEALRILGIDIGSGESSEQVKESRPDPSLIEHPTRELPPETPAAVDVGLIPAAEVLAYRALERAGNRLRSLRNLRPECSADEVYLHLPVRSSELDGLLTDAWTCIPKVMRGIPFDQQQAVQAGLDSYVRALLVGQKEHDIDLMRRHLTHSPVRQLA